MHREHLALVAGVVTAACVPPYLVDMRRGATRPQRASGASSRPSVIGAIVAGARVGQGGGGVLGKVAPKRST